MTTMSTQDPERLGGRLPLPHPADLDNEQRQIHQAPTATVADAQVTHRLTTRLVHEHAVSDELYAQVTDAFGEAALVALLCLIGQYQTISSILVTFAVPVPAAGAHR